MSFDVIATLVSVIVAAVAAWLVWDSTHESIS
jgi:hypothetical protein